MAWCAPKPILEAWQFFGGHGHRDRWSPLRLVPGDRSAEPQHVCLLHVLYTVTKSRDAPEILKGFETRRSQSWTKDTPYV